MIDRLRLLLVALVLTLLGSVAAAAPLPARWVFNTFENECVGPDPNYGQIRLDGVELVADSVEMPLVPVLGAEFRDPRTGIRLFDLFAEKSSRALELNCAAVAEVDDHNALLAEFRRRDRYVEAEVSVEGLPLPGLGILNTFRSTLHSGKMGVIVFAQGAETLMISTWGTR